MRINGLESLSADQVNFELSQGAKFVCYDYCFSIVILTFRRSSDVYFIAAAPTP